MRKNIEEKMKKLSQREKIICKFLILLALVSSFFSLIFGVAYLITRELCFCFLFISFFSLSSFTDWFISERYLEEEPIIKKVIPISKEEIKDFFRMMRDKKFWKYVFGRY